MFFVVMSTVMTGGALFGCFGPKRLTKLGKRGRIASAVILALLIPFDYSVIMVIRADPTALTRRNCATAVSKLNPFPHQVCY